eukprot:m51a1_g4046 hypothetical protein (363) ;mRNA; f:689425-690513
MCDCVPLPRWARVLARFAVASALGALLARLAPAHPAFRDAARLLCASAVPLALASRLLGPRVAPAASSGLADALCALGGLALGSACRLPAALLLACALHAQATWASVARSRLALLRAAGAVDRSDWPALAREYALFDCLDGGLSSASAAQSRALFAGAVLLARPCAAREVSRRVGRPERTLWYAGMRGLVGSRDLRTALAGDWSAAAGLPGSPTALLVDALAFARSGDRDEDRRLQLAELGRAAEAGSGAAWYWLWVAQLPLAALREVEKDRRETADGAREFERFVCASADDLAGPGRCREQLLRKAAAAGHAEAAYIVALLVGCQEPLTEAARQERRALLEQASQAGHRASTKALQCGSCA